MVFVVICVQFSCNNFYVKRCLKTALVCFFFFFFLILFSHFCVKNIIYFVSCFSLCLIGCDTWVGWLKCVWCGNRKKRTNKMMINCCARVNGDLYLMHSLKPNRAKMNLVFVVFSSSSSLSSNNTSFHYCSMIVWRISNFLLLSSINAMRLLSLREQNRNRFDNFQYDRVSNIEHFVVEFGFLFRMRRKIKMNQIK